MLTLFVRNLQRVTQVTASPKLAASSSSGGNRLRVASKSEIIERYTELYGKKEIDMLAFYSSDLDAIIEDPSLMLVPIDDRMINRAHGCFDALTVHNFRFRDLRNHLTRFQHSARSIDIELPMDLDRIEDTMKELARFSYQKLLNRGKTRAELANLQLSVRIWLSSGYGDFWIYSLNKRSVFYCACFINNVPVDKLSETGVKEYTIPAESPIFNLHGAKTMQYITNALMANFSKRRGGYQGLKLDANGHVLETAMANIALVTKDGYFVAVPPEHILEGTTIKRVMQHVRQALIPKGVIKEVVHKYFTVEEALEMSAEAMIIGGDKVFALTHIDDRQIGTGSKGAVCQEIQKWFYASTSDDAVKLRISQEVGLTPKGDSDSVNF